MKKINEKDSGLFYLTMPKSPCKRCGKAREIKQPCLKCATKATRSGMRQSHKTRTSPKKSKRKEEGEEEEEEEEEEIAERAPAPHLPAFILGDGIADSNADGSDGNGIDDGSSDGGCESSRFGGGGGKINAGDPKDTRRLAALSARIFGDLCDESVEGGISDDVFDI